MSIPETRPESLRKYRATDFTGTTYTVTAGFKKAADLPTDILPLQGFRGISGLLAVGTGNDNSTFNVRMFGVWRIEDNTTPTTQDFYVGELFTATGTLASGVAFPADAAVFPSYKVADTIVVTQTDIIDFVEAVYAREIVVSSPADDALPAMIALPDAGNMLGIVLDVDINAGGGTAATAVNFLIARGT